MKSDFEHLIYPVMRIELQRGLITQLNRAASRLIGAGPIPLAEVLPSADREALLRVARRASRSGLSVTRASTLRWDTSVDLSIAVRALDEPPLMDISLSATRGSDQVILSITPRPEQRAAAREERRTSQFLQRLLDLTQTLFFVIDRELHITFANSAVWAHLDQDHRRAPDQRGARRSGATRSLLKLSSLVSPQLSDLIAENLDLCAAQQTPHQVQLEWPDARGERRVFQTLMQPLIGQKAQTEQVLVLCSDITELIDAYEEQHTLQRALDQAQRLESIGQMAGNIAHDFNGFLTVIISSLDLLDPDELDEESRELIEGMTAVSHQARGLIQDLLSFSRAQVISQQRGSLERLNEQLRFALPRLGKSHAEVRYHADLQHPHTLPLSESQCGQILVNLVNNAIEALPQDRDRAGEVSVHCETSAEHTRWEVRDNGLGIPPDLLEQIFEPFFTTKRDRGGTGLGLASARSLIVRAGGDIEVESSVGSGTCFVVTLPAVEPEP